jgi:hypothetical protein
VSGAACGAFVEEGRLVARDADLSGGYGLLQRSGGSALSGGSARGDHAGVAILGGTAELRGLAITGPSTEAGITVSRGTASLEGVVVRSPGPSGIAVSAGGTVDGAGVDVAGAREVDGFLGACAQVRRGSLRLEGSALARCGGAAVEASGGSIALRGVEAEGGSAGCLVLLDGARGELVANVCGGHGPGLVAASGAHASARLNRWRTDPALWVDCGKGARVDIGPGERVKEPCHAPP